MRCAFAGRVAFVGYCGDTSACWIQHLDLGPDRPALVIASELPSNPGTSITYAFDRLATAFCADRMIDPATIFWVEHYMGSHRRYRPDRCCERWESEMFRRVAFDVTPNPAGPGVLVCRPSWVLIDREALDRLGRGVPYRWPPERAEIAVDDVRRR